MEEINKSIIKKPTDKSKIIKNDKSEENFTNKSK